MITAVALVAMTGPSAPLAGGIAYLVSPALPGGFLFGITNLDGYVVFPQVPVPFSGILQMAGSCQYYQQPVSVAGSNVTIRVGPSPSNPQDLQLPACVPFKHPFRPAPRVWRGNFCGVRVPGLPAVEGGADPALVLSWFYDRYQPADRQRIRGAWAQRGHTHVVLSWPDSRDIGQSPAQFKATCQELISAGFFPCVMLCSKDHDPPDVIGIFSNIAPVLPLLIGLVPMFCVGWELSLWLSPFDVQSLIAGLSFQWLHQPGTLGYVHFQQGYFAYQMEGQTTADFWKANVGMLTGVLHQRDLSWDKPMYQARITDCLARFNGGFNFPSDSGFGHPFDFVPLEITAQPAFDGQMTETEQNSWGDTALATPPVGEVCVMGSGNGATWE